METDPSNQAIAGILSQYHVVNKYIQLQPVEYNVKSLCTIWCTWPIHDKELFAIVECFRKWRHLLVGLKVNMYIDHQRLQYFNTQQKVNF